MIRILGNYFQLILLYLSNISNSKYLFFTFFHFLTYHDQFYIQMPFLNSFIFFLNLYHVLISIMILFTLCISNALILLCLEPSILFLSEELAFIPLYAATFNCNLIDDSMFDLLIFLSFLKHVLIYSQSQVHKLIHLV